MISVSPAIIRDSILDMLGHKPFTFSSASSCSRSPRLIHVLGLSIFLGLIISASLLAIFLFCASKSGPFTCAVAATPIKAQAKIVSKRFIQVS
ncbi:MAG: DUF1286 domain-containing protein [Prevotellaceae bacterium]|nr:DUF1286 domain-containing protein [Prevotellaceae bacterium]